MTTPIANEPCEKGTQRVDGQCILNEIVWYTNCTKDKGFELISTASSSAKGKLGFQWANINVGSVIDLRKKITMEMHPTPLQEKICDDCLKLIQNHSKLSKTEPENPTTFESKEESCLQGNSESCTDCIALLVGQHKDFRLYQDMQMANQNLENANKQLNIIKSLTTLSKMDSLSLQNAEQMLNEAKNRQAQIHDVIIRSKTARVF
jgi:hypothetical protein